MTLADDAAKHVQQKELPALHASTDLIAGSLSLAPQSLVICIWLPGSGQLWDNSI